MLSFKFFLSAMWIKERITYEMVESDKTTKLYYITLLTNTAGKMAKPGKSVSTLNWQRKKGAEEDFAPCEKPLKDDCIKNIKTRFSIW